jgi:hypothetical protein
LHGDEIGEALGGGEEPGSARVVALGGERGRGRALGAVRTRRLRRRGGGLVGALLIALDSELGEGEANAVGGGRRALRAQGRE